MICSGEPSSQKVSEGAKTEGIFVNSEAIFNDILAAAWNLNVNLENATW